MLRELASMTHEEAKQWQVDRSWEALQAYLRGDISEHVYDNIRQWSVDQYLLWVKAHLIGLLGKGE